MMRPLAGPSLSVRGSTSAIAAAGPRPGSTPTTVPRTAPARHASTLAGWSPATSAVAKPRSVTGLSQESRGQRHAEPRDEDRPGSRGHAERERRRAQPPPLAEQATGEHDE